MGLGGVTIAALHAVMCLEVPFSDGLGGVEAASFSVDYKPYATCCERSSERVRQVFFVYNHISSLLTSNNKQN